MRSKQLPVGACGTGTSCRDFLIVTTIFLDQSKAIYPILPIAYFVVQSPRFPTRHKLPLMYHRRRSHPHDFTPSTDHAAKGRLETTKLARRCLARGGTNSNISVPGAHIS